MAASSARRATSTSGASGSLTGSAFPWAAWGGIHENESPHENSARGGIVRSGAGVFCFRRSAFKPEKWFCEKCFRGCGGGPPDRCRQHARCRRAALSRQLRPLSRDASEISAAHDGNNPPPHAGPGHHHRRRPSPDPPLHDPVTTKITAQQTDDNRTQNSNYVVVDCGRERPSG